MREKHVTVLSQIITKWRNALIKRLKNQTINKNGSGFPEPFLHKKSKELKTNNKVRQ